MVQRQEQLELLHRVTDEALFAQAFYKVELKQYAKRSGAVADGDQFVLYYDKDGLVMTDTASGNKLTGEATALQGDFLEVTDTMAVLTAAVDGEGRYTFTNAAGQYLTTGATGNSLTLCRCPFGVQPLDSQGGHRRLPCGQRQRQVQWQCPGAGGL